MRTQGLSHPVAGGASSFLPPFASNQIPFVQEKENKMRKKRNKKIAISKKINDSILPNFNQLESREENDFLESWK